MPDDINNKELVLPIGTFAFILDDTKGLVNVGAGPFKTSLSNTDRLVRYNSETKRLDPASGTNAIQTNIVCAKGSYIILENPGKRQPELGKADIMATDMLDYGRIENLPGPRSFPLWPGQVARVIKGHHLRTNQYLVVRVYDDEAAQANWSNSVVKKADSSSNPNPTDDSGKSSELKGNESTVTKKTKRTEATLSIDSTKLITGQLIIIRGTEVAFYIPPTGIEVLEFEGNYVQDAVTLERLEYSILLGEDGEKEYTRGPAVVFPTPTQTFFTRASKDSSGREVKLRKFRAFELQPTNGIHVKVIADYQDDGDELHRAGDEIFITGTDTPIYYPREEHAILSYGGSEKTYAVAVPAGEGRYVLDRRNGKVDLVIGPNMFLPNPINEVIVRRILSDSECELYYPNNNEVLDFNRELAAKGVDASTDVLTMNAAIARSSAPSKRELIAAASAAAPAVFGDVLTRSTQYTPPRMITLDTKFDGAVQINVWSGYAVQVVNSKGERKTIIGPQTVLLEYDQKLERLTLSTGKPKTNDRLINTPYLQYISNPVSDILSLKTHDLVNVNIQVKYLVRFEQEESTKWFDVANYVQYMVDHLRSLIGNAVRNIDVQTFYSSAATVLRDIVLGKKEGDKDRPLKHFTENGMTIYDLELISVTVQDKAVADMLARAHQETLTDQVSLERTAAQTEFVRGVEVEKRKQLQERAATTLLQTTITKEASELQDKIELEGLERTNTYNEQEQEGIKAITAIKKAISQFDVEMETARRQMTALFANEDVERTIKLGEAEAEARKTQLEAIAPQLIEALTAIAQTGQFKLMAEHLAPLALVRGESLSGTLEHILKGTPLENMLKNIQSIAGRKPALENE